MYIHTIRTQTTYSSETIGFSGYTEAYRYGFQGQERDDEVKNLKGTSYDFGARMYDPRVGRFLSLDRKIMEYPFQSAYCFAGNSPILFLDINGDFKIKVTDEAKKEKGADIKIARFESVLKDLENYLNENPLVVKQISKQTGLSEEEILNDAKYGEGPTIYITTVDLYAAQASSESFNLKESGFDIDYAYVESMENYEPKTDLNKAKLNLLIAGTILHEYTHWGDRSENDGDLTGGSIDDLGTQGTKSNYNHRGTDVEVMILGVQTAPKGGPIRDNDGERIGSDWQFDPEILDQIKVLSLEKVPFENQATQKNALPMDQKK